MTPAELSLLDTTHPYIQWQDSPETGCVMFRNIHLPYYMNNPNKGRAIPYDELDNLSVDDVIKRVNKGLEVLHISRVTGYFSIVERWNPGKRAELKDRRRTDLYGNPAHIGMSELDALQKEMAVA